MNGSIRKEVMAKWILGLMTLFILFVVLFIIVFIFDKGLSAVTPEFLLSGIEDAGRSGGIYPTFVSTFLLIILTLIIAIPLGIGTAIYLTEYTVENRITEIIRFGTNTLAGIPSIIFGLFGFIFFVGYLGLGWSILSGALTLSCMVLPTIIRTSEEAIKSVPRKQRLVSYSLGAGKWQTITRVVQIGRAHV